MTVVSYDTFISILIEEGILNLHDSSQGPWYTFNSLVSRLSSQFNFEISPYLFWRFYSVKTREDLNTPLMHYVYAKALNIESAFLDSRGNPLEVGDKVLISGVIAEVMDLNQNTKKVSVLRPTKWSLRPHSYRSSLFPFELTKVLLPEVKKCKN